MVPVERLESKGYRSFGLIFGTIIVILFGFFVPLIFKGQWPVWPDTLQSTPFIIGYVLYAWSLVLPSTLVVIYVPWMHFGHIMGAINTRLILGLVFYLLFTPMSLVLTIFGKDPLKRKFEATQESYWKKCQDRPKEHMEHNY